ncbi:hypothetical protein J416_07522 [Gracilibacillus halophilus YIM-C55.5]|uniref:STAS domain-containing protein n=1 Tax=Gracilibacillus halophilus YIM-C55.5 TaxID=1308866 RepID=N4WLJ5_9BACI|nr:STAS domain-containing protein [Gracilibacillus halophilus]ENH97027.1 hypothetical protein J416_07522 [Gracilibacillus halophilus YIM-C55.5]
MLFSLSDLYHQKQEELYAVAKDHAFTSEETLKQSQELDQFVTHYQKKERSELTIIDVINGSTLLLELNGQLDMMTSEKIYSYLESKKDMLGSMNQLNINLIHLGFFDTTGIRSLVQLILEACRYGIEILVEANQSTFDLLKLMGIPTMFDEYKCATYCAV